MFSTQTRMAPRRTTAAIGRPNGQRGFITSADERIGIAADGRHLAGPSPAALDPRRGRGLTNST
jgi:hypothetical protein